MATYKCKSIIIGRTKKEKYMEDTDERPCFVAIYNVNTPHLSGKEPKEILNFVSHKIMIRDLNIDFLLLGKDILIDGLESVSIEDDGDGHIIVTGKQRKE